MKFSAITKENLKRELLGKYQENILIIKRELNNRKTNLNSAQLKIHQNYREKLKNKELLFNKAINNIDIIINKIFISIEESDLYKLIKEEDKNELYIKENFFCFTLFNDKRNVACKLKPNLCFEDAVHCEKNKFDFTCYFMGEQNADIEGYEKMKGYDNNLENIIYTIESDVNKVIKELTQDFRFINADFNIYFFSNLESIENIDETKFNENIIKNRLLEEIKIVTFFNCDNYVDYRFDDYKRIKDEFKNFFERYLYTNGGKEISYNEITSLISNLNKDLLLYGIQPINIDLSEYLFNISKFQHRCNSAKVILEKHDSFELIILTDIFKPSNDLEKLKLYFYEKNKSEHTFTGFLLDEYLSNKEEVINHIKMMRY